MPSICNEDLHWYPWPHIDHEGINRGSTKSGFIKCPRIQPYPLLSFPVLIPSRNLVVLQVPGVPYGNFAGAIRKLQNDFWITLVDVFWS
jgi:hypothetical protein